MPSMLSYSSCRADDARATMRESRDEAIEEGKEDTKKLREANRSATLRNPDSSHETHQLDIRSHLCNLLDLDHDQLVNLGELVLIVPHFGYVFVRS
jgi:hypothetical protein